jgi:hypothetical protein
MFMIFILFHLYFYQIVLNGGGSITTKNSSPLAKEFDFDNVKRGGTASYSHAPSDAS